MEQAREREDYVCEEHEDYPDEQMTGTVWECRNYTPEGTYSVVVTDAWIHRTPGGADTLVIELTDPHRHDRGPHFAFLGPLNSADNNAYVNSALSAIVKYEVRNGDYIDLTDLLGRFTTVVVDRHRNGKRVMFLTRSKEEEKDPRYALWRFTDSRHEPQPYTEYIPLYGREE